MAILSVGHIGNEIQSMIKSLKNPELVGHFDMRFVKPLDENLLRKVFKDYQQIITVEDGCILGGFGSAILEFANELGFKNPIKVFGVPDKFIEQGEISETHQMAGIDFDSILTFVQSTLDQCG